MSHGLRALSLVSVPRSVPGSVPVFCHRLYHSKEKHLAQARTQHSNTAGEDNTGQKKGKTRWTTSYFKMTIREAEKRLGVRLESLSHNAIPVERILAQSKSINGGGDSILKTKERVYAGIVGYLEIEGYPTEANPDFKEANINDLVYIMLHPILLDFRRKTGCYIRLQREKEIVSVDSETGGTEEFVVMDLISVTKDRFVLVIEAKKASLGEATKQSLLAMKDMKDNNSYSSGGGDGGGDVYGFVTKMWSTKDKHYGGLDVLLGSELNGQ